MDGRMNVPKDELIDVRTDGMMGWPVTLWPLPDKLCAVCFDVTDTDPHIPNLDTKYWRVSFVLWPLYIRTKNL